MLDHEIMFKNQVQELHGLYAVQKLLVKSDPRYPRCELFPMKRAFTETHSVGPSRLMFDQDIGSRCQQRPLDLRLSTGYSCDDDVLDCDELNLSLSIGMSSNKRIKSSKKPIKNSMAYPSSPVIIDLEDSTESVSYEFFKAKLPQDNRKMNGEMHQECSSLNQGSIGWHDVKRMDLVDLDLNKDQPDEYPSCGKSSSQSATSLTFKRQVNPCTIDLESLPEPEPSSDLTEEKVINISEASEEDYTEEKAALSLISISNQLTLTKNQDSENRNEKKKKTNTRSLSIDSYESLVLKLEESSIEEDTATSKTYEMNELDPKENGIKLRRGRRLKDFQKDILPTLSSLSKHEIWEDIKLLEGVIRSREYKRLNKVKAAKGENCSTPVKGKRVKVNSSGQKSSIQKRKS